jgi:hypothetical protein
MDESATGFTMEELREFLEGDLLGAPADPEFKENLRSKLREMVRSQRLRDAKAGLDRDR